MNHEGKEKDKKAEKISFTPMRQISEISASNFAAGQSVVIDVIRWRLDEYTVIRTFIESGRERVELRRKRDNKTKIVAPGDIKIVNEALLSELQRKADAEARARQYRKRFTYMSK